MPALPHPSGYLRHPNPPFFPQFQKVPRFGNILALSLLHFHCLKGWKFKHEFVWDLTPFLEPGISEERFLLCRLTTNTKRLTKMTFRPSALKVLPSNRIITCCRIRLQLAAAISSVAEECGAVFGGIGIPNTNPYQ